MSQTSYATNMTRGYAGMRADAGPKDVASFVSEEASAEIPFGVVVAFGASEGLCELPDASTDVLCGVVLAEQTFEVGNELGTTGVKPKLPVSVLRKGRVLVRCEDAVTPGQRLFVRYASGAGGTQLGSCRRSAVASETIDATTQGVFLTSASAGGLAVLEVDFTAKP
jgi:hypothetical protein